MLVDQIQHLINVINDLSGGNDMVAGVIMASLLGSSIFMLRSLITSLIDILKKQMTTTMTLKSNVDVFHLFNSYIEKNYEGIKDKGRIISTTSLNGYGRTVKTFGEGTHIIRLNGAFVRLVKTSEKSGNTYLESITITKLGRSHTWFNDIIKKLKDMEDNNNECLQKVSRWEGGDINFVRYQEYTLLDSVVLPKALKKK